MKVLSHIKLAARLEYLQTFMDFVSSCAGEQGFGQKGINEIELATEEALVNIFNYAYKGTNGEVEITCKLDNNNNFILEIADSGFPFNVLSVEDPDITADISERQIGGLGVLLMKKLTDSVQYRYEGDKNILTLIFLKIKVISDK